LLCVVWNCRCLWRLPLKMKVGCFGIAAVTTPLHFDAAGLGDSLLEFEADAIAKKQAIVVDGRLGRAEGALSSLNQSAWGARCLSSASVSGVFVQYVVSPPPQSMLSRLLSRPHATHVARRLPVAASRALSSSPLLRAIDMAKVDTTERLAELRKLMKERNVDVYSMARVRISPAYLTHDSGSV